MNDWEGGGSGEGREGSQKEEESKATEAMCPVLYVPCSLPIKPYSLGRPETFLRVEQRLKLGKSP